MSKNQFGVGGGLKTSKSMLGYVRKHRWQTDRHFRARKTPTHTHTHTHTHTLGCNSIAGPARSYTVGHTIHQRQRGSKLLIRLHSVSWAISPPGLGAPQNLA